MPTAGELTLLRADRARLMDKTCQVQRPTTVTGTGGGTRQTWATAGTLACNKYEAYAARGGGEEPVGGVPNAKTMYDIYLPYEAGVALSITAACRLVIDGETLEIAQAPKPDSHDLALHLVASVTGG